jgi:putative ABC transport system substrate-binding protein
LLCSAEQRRRFRKRFRPNRTRFRRLLSARARDESSDLTAAFGRGLEADGFVAGRNLRIEISVGGIQIRTVTVAGNRSDRSAGIGNRRSRRRSFGSCFAVTAVVPIVFVSAGDPIAFGLVSRLNRPNGNLTGISVITVALAPKRLQLLHELVPAPAGMAMLANSSSPYFEQEKMDVMASARALGRKLQVFSASNAMEIETAFSSLRDGRGALLVSGDPYFDGERDRLVSLAAHYSVPTVYQWREFVTIGGLMSFATRRDDAAGVDGAAFFPAFFGASNVSTRAKREAHLCSKRLSR